LATIENKRKQQIADAEAPFRLRRGELDAEHKQVIAEIMQHYQHT
jgi:hypothetical protein